MERQAVLSLFQCFLEKRGIKGLDLKKELPGLLAAGVAKGCFADPNTVLEEGEWRRFGDKLWEGTIEDDKIAKKLGKQWRVVINALQQHKAEQQAARAAAQRLGEPSPPVVVTEPNCPLPPATNVINIPTEPSGKGSDLLSAPAVPPTPEGPSTPLSGSAPPPNFLDPPEPPSNPFLESSKLSKNPFRDSAPVLPPEELQMTAMRRQMLWQNIAADAMQAGDRDAAESLTSAFPVVYSQVPGGMQANINNLDWKILSQLRATVSENGVQSEPVRQMLDYIWGGNLLLPEDIKNIMKLILTQHQQLLYNAYWQSFCQESVAVQRQAGDPLYGITLEELMGLGPWRRSEAQALLGPDKIRESMHLARLALRRVKAPGGVPSYMGIKQGREEPFGSFVDRVASAIQAAGVPEYMHGALLKHCAIQNCNSVARSVIVTLPGTWSIEELLERMQKVPQGPNAMLVEAVKDLGESLREKARATSSQVLAALAPLQSPAASAQRNRATKYRCFRCGAPGHMRRECQAGPVWCMRCHHKSHANPLACDCHLFQLVPRSHRRRLSAVMDFQEKLHCLLLTLPAPVGILSLAGRQPLNCSEARETVLEGHLGDTVTLSCDTRLQGVQSWYWVTPGGEKAPEESGNGSTLLLANGSLQLRALRPEDPGTYSCWVGGPVLNETLYVELRVHNFTLHGPHDTLNTVYTTLVGCILSVVLVLIYLYLTPCRCYCCRGPEKPPPSPATTASTPSSSGRRTPGKQIKECEKPQHEHPNFGSSVHPSKHLQTATSLQQPATSTSLPRQLQPATSLQQQPVEASGRTYQQQTPKDPSEHH